MMSIGAINFSNGAYSGNHLNGMEAWIMESAEKADIVINDFEKLYESGMDPYNLLDQIRSERKYHLNDFTNSDINRINNRINKIIED